MLKDQRCISLELNVSDQVCRERSKLSWQLTTQIKRPETIGQLRDVLDGHAWETVSRSVYGTVTSMEDSPASRMNSRARS